MMTPAYYRTVTIEGCAGNQITHIEGKLFTRPERLCRQTRSTVILLGVYPSSGR
jgi:hypothetical protein